MCRLLSKAYGVVLGLAKRDQMLSENTVWKDPERIGERGCGGSYG